MKINPLHYVLLAGIDAAPSSGYDLTLWLANLGQHFGLPSIAAFIPLSDSFKPQASSRIVNNLGKGDRREKSIV
jgi:hypothetical protein